MCYFSDKFPYRMFFFSLCTEISVSRLNGMGGFSSNIKSRRGRCLSRTLLCDNGKIPAQGFVAAAVLPNQHRRIHQGKQQHCHGRIQVSIPHLPQVKPHKKCHWQTAPEQCDRRWQKPIANPDPCLASFIFRSHPEGQGPLETVAAPQEPEPARCRKIAAHFGNVPLQPLLAAPEQQLLMPEDHP